MRDQLLGLPHEDIDIATSATPHQVMSLFEKTIPVGVEFGSVVVVQDGHSFEVTTFRKEGPYLDGRHPSSVELSDAKEDAKRRDLTINGMFYDPLTDTIHDFVGGQEDLKAKIIRAIGDPKERFEEDRLRMIRAIRFSVQFDFPIEEDTAKAIQEQAHTLFPSVAIERVYQEFQKNQSPHFFKKLFQFGLLQEIFPGVNKPEANFVPEAPTIGNLALLFPSREERLKMCERLKASNKDREFIELLSAVEKGGDVVIWVHLYANDDTPICLKLLGKDDQRDAKLAPHIERIRKKLPLVTSAHLKERGIEPGREMGELLKKAERIAITKDLHSAEEVLSLLFA